MVVLVEDTEDPSSSSSASCSSIIISSAEQDWHKPPKLFNRYLLTRATMIPAQTGSRIAITMLYKFR
jgi:hypothetical protein